MTSLIIGILNWEKGPDPPVPFALSTQGGQFCDLSTSGAWHPNRKILPNGFGIFFRLGVFLFCIYSYKKGRFIISPDLFLFYEDNRQIIFRWHVTCILNDERNIKRLHFKRGFNRVC